MADDLNTITIFQDLYLSCVRARIVANKTQFAVLIGANRSVVTAALNGDTKYMNEALLQKAQKAVTEAMLARGEQVIMENKDQATGNIQNNYHKDNTGEDMKVIVDKLVGEMAAQRESYEKIIALLIEKVGN